MNNNSQYLFIAVKKNYWRNKRMNYDKVNELNCKEKEDLINDIIEFLEDNTICDSDKIIEIRHVFYEYIN